MKQAALSDLFKKTSNSVSIPTTVVCPDPCLLLLPLLQLFRLHKTQIITLMTLTKQVNKISKWNTPLNNGTAQVQQ